MKCPSVDLPIPPPKLGDQEYNAVRQASLYTLGTTVWLRPSSLLVIQEQVASPTRHTSMPCPSFLKERLSHVHCHLKAPTPKIAQKSTF